jgi:ABC-type polysaccharide/polyol phosphate export permease
MPLIMHSDPRTYAIYLLATLPLWNFMAVSLSSSTYSLIANAETLKRCMISSSVFPVADVLKNAYSYLVGFVGMAIIALVIGLPLSWHILLLPIYFLPVLLTMMCLCVGLAYIVPYVQDLKDAIAIAMNMLVWASAVVYPITALPGKAQKIMHWNPLYILLEPSIILVYQQQLPDPVALTRLWIVMCLSLVFGYTLYRIGSRNYVYYL